MSKRTPKLLLRGAVAGEYGKDFVVTLKNFDNEPQNVSTYTGINLYFRSPDGTKTVTCTGSFVTDGSDAQVQWNFSSTSPLDREGIWEGQIKLTQTGQLTRSYVFDLECDRSIG